MAAQRGVCAGSRQGGTGARALAHLERELFRNTRSWRYGLDLDTSQAVSTDLALKPTPV